MRVPGFFCVCLLADDADVAGLESPLPEEPASLAKFRRRVKALPKATGQVPVLQDECPSHAEQVQPTCRQDALL
jgi:hypothetical protein